MKLLSKLILLPVFLLIFFSSSLLAESEDTLMRPPDGYDWQTCGNAALVLLKPKGWHFKQIMGGELECYVTKENMELRQGFQTGVRLSLREKFSAGKGVSAVEFAQKFASVLAKQVKKNGDSIHRQWSEEFGTYKIFGLEHTRVSPKIRANGSNQEDRRLHQLVLGSDKNDVFIHFSFETLASLWDLNWPIASKIASTLGLSD